MTDALNFDSVKESVFDAQQVSISEVADMNATSVEALCGGLWADTLLHPMMSSVDFLVDYHDAVSSISWNDISETHNNGFTVSKLFVRYVKAIVSKFPAHTYLLQRLKALGYDNDIQPTCAYCASLLVGSMCDKCDVEQNFGRRVVVNNKPNKCTGHFDSCVDNIAGGGLHKVKPDVIEVVEREIGRQFIDKNDVTAEDVRAILKAEGMKDDYKHSQAIADYIRGYAQFELPPEIRIILNQMVKEIGVGLTISGDRTNMFRAGFLVKKCCKLLGYPVPKGIAKTPGTKSRKDSLNKQWQRAIEACGWVAKKEQKVGRILIEY